MLRYIENARRKPEHVRRQIAVAVTIGLFAAVVVLWMVLGGARFGVKAPQPHRVEQNNAPAPLSALKETFSTTAEEAGKLIEAFSRLKDR